jgi:hypothetical protein
MRAKSDLTDQPSECGLPLLFSMDSVFWSIIPPGRRHGGEFLHTLLRLGAGSLTPTHYEISAAAAADPLRFYQMNILLILRKSENKRSI